MSDLGADLAGSLAVCAYDRIAKAHNLANTICADENVPLNELQSIHLMRAMLACFDGFEAELASQLSVEAGLRTGRMNGLLGYDLGAL